MSQNCDKFFEFNVIYPRHGATEEGEFLNDLKDWNMWRESCKAQLHNWITDEIFMKWLILVLFSVLFMNWRLGKCGNLCILFTWSHFYISDSGRIQWDAARNY